MGNIATSGGAGGITSDDVTTILAHVLAGETAVTHDSGDEAGVGTMTVNSLLSFSCAAYSGRRVLAKWQNPKAAVGKPYSGIYIRYSTSGYPGKTGGTQIYKGAGNNTSSGGQSQAYIDLPNLSTNYYLSCYPYVTCSAGEMTGNVINAEVTTLKQINLTIKSTQKYTIPAGYSKMDICTVGGGGCGNYSSYNTNRNGSGGGGGYVVNKKNITVSVGEIIDIAIGAGGKSSSGTSGGTSSVSRSGATLCSANGGQGFGGTNGGSGGGGSEYLITTPSSYWGGRGGSNGSNGWIGSLNTDVEGMDGGTGQGSTTRAFGESSGELFSGGGGSGSPSANGSGGRGGDGGGAAGGGKYGVGHEATANTGGGGGGGGWVDKSVGRKEGGNGGSGVVRLRLY